MSDKSFTDEASIAGYAREAVQALARAEVIRGFTDGTYRPRGSTTRAQAASVVYQLLFA